MGVSAGENFEALLDGAVVFLRRRGRVTLRGLGRHLDVDEACVADIRDELVLALRVAEEEEGGKVLVYRDAPSRSASESTGAVSGAERRQLTVMFCDLVGSTVLSSGMDPEDFGDLLHAYQHKCAAVITPFAGHIAQYLGDGILVYFGYPRAHENDVERGIMAGLAIVEAMVELNAELAERGVPELGVRIGIHTGLVVVDEVGTGSTREHLALGEVPNIAAKVQSLGETNSVVISDATRRLVEGRFQVHSRGAHDFTASGQRREVYTVTGRKEPETNVAHRVAMVGREAEMSQLEELLGRSLEGQGEVVFVRGEAGIGKSRVVGELRRKAESEGCDIHVYHASPHFTQTPLYPVSERLRRGLDLDTAPDKMARLREFLAVTDLATDDSVALIATFLNVSGAPETDTTNLIGGMQALIVEWLVRNAKRQPTLLTWEDLHWVDPSTLELLGMLLERCRETRVLIAMTFRDSFQPPWELHEPATTVALGKLSRRDLKRLVKAVAADAELPNAMLDEVLTKTDGIPLFAEELAKTLLDAGTRKSSIPATLQDLLMARLDRLGRAKEIAQLGASIGREFSHQLLATVSDMDSASLDDGLDRLIGSGLAFRYGQGATRFYRFKHALVQDAAYEAILLGRRRPIHRRIAAALEAELPQLVAERPELLAHHLTEAGMAERAIASWLRAGEHAAERSANLEAVAHFDRGLQLLDTLEDASLAQQLELELQVPRAGALRATRGFAAPETGAAFNRARELCHAIGPTQSIIPVLNGIYSFHLVRNELDRAGAAAHELLQHAREQRNETYEMIGYRAVGAVLLHTGHPATALGRLEQSIALYDIERHKALAFRYGTDHKETASSFLAVSQYLLGDIDSAYATHAEAIDHSERLAHAHSIAQALGYFGLVLSMNRDREALAEHGRRLHELSTRDHAFPFFAAIGAFWLAHAQAMETPNTATIESMRDAAAQWLASGGGTYQPYLLSLIAEAHVATEPADGLPFVERAKTRIETTNERFTEPELHRIEGDLLRAAGKTEQAETCYRRALAVATERGMRTWARRAAIHLAELWRSAGRDAEALALLAPIQDAFNQGQAFADHARATALLRELR
jgi:class 3 adenylate cyclase/tetratricopeptide (TPR) repeat protein